MWLLAPCSLTAEVPYHNFNHAVDVTVSSYLILTACNARAQLKPVDVFTLMVAAIGHDVAHPGLTNGAFPAKSPQSPNTPIFLSCVVGTGFHVHAQSDVFKEFGEVSPLETMHATKTLATATAEGSNILAGLSDEDVRVTKLCCPTRSPTPNARRFHLWLCG